MTITEDEMKSYKAFIMEQVATLEFLEIHPNEVIWHYTTGSALLNIIETGTLYATQVSWLNDSTELSYASRLMHEAGTQLGAGKLSENERAALDGLKKAQAEGSLNPTTLGTTATSWWFVTCFSTERDDLSQWRAYSSGENGYAIGFRVGGLFRPDSVVVRVNYNEARHKIVAQRVAAATLHFFMKGLEDGHRELIPWAQEFFPLWENLTGELAPMVKNPAFRAEKEFRIIHQLKTDELAKVRFAQKRSLISRHLPLAFPPPDQPDSTMLPIVEVLVGPSRHMEVSRVSVDTLMRQRKYTVPVRNSDIPFQMT